MRYYWNEDSILDASYIPFRGPATVRDAAGVTISRVLACDTETGYVVQLATDADTGKLIVRDGQVVQTHRHYLAPLCVESIPLYNYSVKYPRAGKMSKRQRDKR